MKKRVGETTRTEPIGMGEKNSSLTFHVPGNGHSDFRAGKDRTGNGDLRARVREIKREGGRKERMRGVGKGETAASFSCSPCHRESKKASSSVFSSRVLCTPSFSRERV